jgi:hypothetical protein
LVSIKIEKMESEKLLERNLREKVKKMGGWAVKFWAISTVGFPDRITLSPNGKINFVELKSEGKKPTPIQASVHRKLEALGFNVFVIDTTEKLNDFLEYLKK